jgi:hypothetical protein
MPLQIEVLALLLRSLPIKVGRSKFKKNKLQDYSLGILFIGIGDLNKNSDEISPEFLFSNLLTHHLIILNMLLMHRCSVLSVNA